MRSHSGFESVNSTENSPDVQSHHSAVSLVI